MHSYAFLAGKSMGPKMDLAGDSASEVAPSSKACCFTSMLLQIAKSGLS